MKSGIYSVYDSKAQAYMQPFFSHNDSVAIRACGHAANTEGHDFANYAEDYILFGLGEFDETTGKIEPTDPRSICGIHTLIRKDKPVVKTEE